MVSTDRPGGPPDATDCAYITIGKGHFNCFFEPLKSGYSTGVDAGNTNTPTATLYDAIRNSL